MTFIATTPPEAAAGETAALYRRLRGRGASVPNYARVFSHRPLLMEHIRALMESLRDAMPPRLWKLASFAAARAGRSTYCSLAFAHKLLGEGLSEGELLAIAGGDSAALAPREAVAMGFAARVAGDTSQIREAEVEALRAAGFSDTEIFDIAAAAAFRGFFSRIADALGVRADAELTHLSPALLAALCVGRPPADPQPNPTSRSTP